VEASARFEQRSSAQSARAELRRPGLVDRVEISEHARALSQESGDRIRTDLVQRVRSEIEADTYLTTSRIDAAARAISRQLRPSFRM